MKTWLAPIVLAVGILLALIGFWWLWTGLDIVQVERGWSAVISGATMLSAGLIIAAMSAILMRLGEIAAALGPAPRIATLPVGKREPAIQTSSPSSAAPPPLSSPPSPSAETSGHAEVSAQNERTVVGRHVSGDSTYVMFSDGSVEAHTPDGLLHFASLDELRVYADERESVGTDRS